MMRPPLEIDSWKRRGHTMLWDAGSLASLCHAEQAVTLRRFLRMHGAGWPEAELEATLVKERALVVAGLDAAIDAMEPDEATAWLEWYRRLWDARFDELDAVVEELQRKETVDGRNERR